MDNTSGISRITFMDGQPPILIRGLKPTESVPFGVPAEWRAFKLESDTGPWTRVRASWPLSSLIAMFTEPVPRLADLPPDGVTVDVTKPPPSLDSDEKESEIPGSHLPPVNPLPVLATSAEEPANALLS